MATDSTLDQFIRDSFSSIWDIELLAAVIDAGGNSKSANDLVTQMRASRLVVEQGMKSLTIAGLVTLEEQDRIRFSPVDESVGKFAKEAIDYYRRFPGRTRRLMISGQTPGLSAFADAFRLRKDDE